MQVLGVPEDMFTERNTAIMVLLISSTTMLKREGHHRYCANLQEHFKAVRPHCFDVYRENNTAKRKAFFGEPMNQFLWHVFKAEQSDMIINYLRRVRSHPLSGEFRYQMLVQDMLMLEQHASLRIIPERARQDDIITTLTAEELEADLRETGKLNKRSE